MITLGADVPRRDAEDKLRGRTSYTTDRTRVGLLHAALRRASVPSARIVSIDVSTAESMPGVHAVVTGVDALGIYGYGVADHPLFATDLVRHVGEPIAAVAAETIEQAEAAAAAIVVELEEMPAVTTMAEALEPGAPLVHPNWAEYEDLVPGGIREGNVAWQAIVDRGDVEAAFARGDVTVVETRVTVGRQNQVPLEPRACIASYEDGRFHIETSTQAPWGVRATVARMLGVRPADVRVTVPPVGGAFGAKFEWAVEPFAALLARASGRPVRIVTTLSEEMQNALCRDNADIVIRSAVTPDGSIVGREAVVLMDCGAYSGEQTFLTTMTAHTLGGNYRLGAVRLITSAVYTHTAPTGAFRACNGVYNTYALERHTDEVCAAIGMDRLEFRRRNVLADGSIGSTGQVFEGDVLGPMLERALEMRAKAAVPAPRDPSRWRRGSATVVGTWFVLVGPSSATINLNVDGTVTLQTSGVEIGSGSTMQAIPQLVASRLGLRPEDVVVRAADTDAAGYDMGVGGGRATVSLGSASGAACDDLGRKILDVAADLLEAAPEDLRIVPGGVEIAGIPGRAVGLQEVAMHAQKTTGPLAGAGSFTRRGTPAMPGCTAGHMLDAIDIPVFCVHDVDVDVDVVTGKVDIRAYRVVQDVGRAINPRAIYGQIQGGVVQGIGYTLHEEITMRPDGTIEQAGLDDYRVPLAVDVPDVVAHLHEGAPSYGPNGAKGAGEVPILNVAAAISCAVSDAIGVPANRLPLTPPRLLGLVLGIPEQYGSLEHLSAPWPSFLVGQARRDGL